MGPTRGQIVVTERTQPFLPHPLTTVRQTDEGTVMIGDSKEDLLDDAVLNPPSVRSWPTGRSACSRCSAG